MGYVKNRGEARKQLHMHRMQGDGGSQASECARGASHELLGEARSRGRQAGRGRSVPWIVNKMEDV